MRAHLASLVDDFRAHGAATAVVAHRGIRRYTTTYGELAELAGRFAAELNRRGIAPGERVVLWGANSAEWIAVFFGCLLRGVLAVPLDARGAPAFARRVLAEVAPRLIVSDPMLLHTLRSEIPADAIAETPTLALTRLRETLPMMPCFAVTDAVRADTPFQILFTSGTTSAPKGIVHTHRNVLASLRPVEAEIAKYRRYARFAHPLCFLHTLPLSHVFGQFMGLWVPALLAAELHLVETHAPAQLVEILHDDRISVLVAVPRVLDLVRAHLQRRMPQLTAELGRTDAPSVLRRWWRFRAVHRLLGWKFWAVISGGAALSPELERFWNQLGYALIQGYGMTETAALITLNHPFRIAQGTIGRALPGREVRLSETGEILVRGDMVATATWQHGRLEPRSGEWLATGDLAELTPAGDLRFLGRSGDAIVTGSGLNVHPTDLEAALLAQPGVRGCVAVPYTLASGPEPVCVTLFSGDDTALAAAADAANRALAAHQQIRRVLRWPGASFPTTSTGKLLRRAVREWACAQLQTGPSSAAGAQQHDTLLQLIAEVTGERVFEAHAALRLSEDLRLDSLGRVQLLSLLEQALDIELAEDAMAALVTLGDLRAAIERALPATQPPTDVRLLIGRHEAERLPSGVAEAPGDVQPPAAAPRPAPLVHGARSHGPEYAGRTTRPSRVDAHRYPRWPWSWPVRLLRFAFQELVARPLLRLLLAPRVLGPTRPLPRGPMLVIGNHLTVLDGPLVLSALPPRVRRRMAVAMSGEMLLHLRRARAQGNAFLNLLAPAAYWLLTALYNVFPLPRLAGFRRSFAHAGAALDRGDSVLLFPEGTRSRTGELGSFRQGIGLLAAQARVPVLPVALLGLEELRSRRVRWFRSGHLAIRIGEPVALPEETSPADWTLHLEHAMRALLRKGNAESR